MNQNLVERVEEALGLLEQIKDVQQIDLPGYRLHQLTGNLKGYWSITVSSNMRITFRFDKENAYDVDLIDYH